MNIVLENNSGSDDDVSAFQFNMIAHPQPKLNPASPPAIASALASLSTWNCTLLPPIQDANPDPNVADSFLGCFVWGWTGSSVPDGGSVILASMTYTATTGASAITIENAVAGNAGGIELGSCNPVLTNSAICRGATFNQVFECPDPNNDNNVNVLDVYLIAQAFGETPPGPPYSLASDPDRNANINVLDLSITAAASGTTCTA